ncbi:MAG TPA: CesT family type III secretion system chaperone [Waddliaceae bacterium]
MVMDLFESLLQELGQIMKIEGLRPDEHNTCLIRFKDGDLEVQIEPYQKGEFLLIGCTIGVISPGRYRENVFREALKANGLPPSRHGVFAYIAKSDRLVLFSMLSLREINGEKIASFLTPFMEKALTWKQQIKRGDVPVAETITSGRVSGPGGLFGLIR